MKYRTSKEELINELNEVIYKWCREYNYSYEEATQMLNDIFKERPIVKNKEGE
jgi:predicted methyltransferase